MRYDVEMNGLAQNREDVDERRYTAGLYLGEEEARGRLGRALSEGVWGEW